MKVREQKGDRPLIISFENYPRFKSDRFIIIRRLGPSEVKPNSLGFRSWVSFQGPNLQLLISRVRQIPDLE